MTPRVVDVDAIGLDMSHAGHLLDLLDGVAMGLDGAEDMTPDHQQAAVGELYALTEALRDRVRAVLARVDAAQPAPAEAAALIDPEEVAS